MNSKIATLWSAATGRRFRLRRLDAATSISRDPTER